MKYKALWLVLAFFAFVIFASGAMGFAPQQASGGILPTPTTSGSTGTTATGSTTGGTTGEILFPQVYITGTQEASGTTSYEHETSHVFRVQLYVNNIPANYTRQPVSGTLPQQYRDDSYNVSLAVENEGNDPVASGTSFTLDNRSESGATESVTINGKAYTAYGYSVLNGDDLTTRINGAHSQLVYVIMAITQTGQQYTLNGDGSKNVISSWDFTDYSEADLNMNRFPLSTASVDTRKTYGQPDLGGELPGEAVFGAACVAVSALYMYNAAIDLEVIALDEDF